MRTSNRRIANLFAPSGWARQCCQVEAALALVQAEIGVIPADAGPGIAQHLHDAVIDHDALAKAAERTGFAIAPLIRQLTPQCGPFGGWLHWGATTQDILVTVRALQINESLKLLGQRLARIVSAVAKLADEHRHTVMPARAFGGHGGVTTFGLHCATWLSSLVRDADRLVELTCRPVAGELFGATGTMASLGSQGLLVQQRMMARLGLPAPLASASGARDAAVEVVLYLALLAGTLGKAAQDISQLTWTEIGEAAEPAMGGRDTSSALPHKANPILSWRVKNAADTLQAHAATALRCLRQDQMRSGVGMLEQEVVAQAFTVAEECLDVSETLLSGLEVRQDRMRENCEITQGLSMSESVQIALAAHTGRLAAHDLVHDACKQAVQLRQPLATVLAGMPQVRVHLDESALRKLLSPEGEVGAASAIVDRCLAAAHERLDALRSLDA